MDIKTCRLLALYNRTANQKMDGMIRNGRNNVPPLGSQQVHFRHNGPKVFSLDNDFSGLLPLV